MTEENIAAAIQHEDGSILAPLADDAPVHGHHLVDDTSDTVWRMLSAQTEQEIRHELNHQFTHDEKERVWKEAAGVVKTYHDELVRRWQEEMDTLLVYAGLFSAVLTAFNVLSYQLLQPTPTDATLAVLEQISAQLNSFTVSPPFVNATRVGNIVGGSQPPFQAPASAVWLNLLWFSSLVFSLASASIALFVKQWLRQAAVLGVSREAARLRQYRLNGLRKWRVGVIVVTLPILLQLAAVMFLVGLLVLLWTLHNQVAAAVSALIALLFAFFLLVTILPVFSEDCSYRSPAALGLYTILRTVRHSTMRMVRRVCRDIHDTYVSVVGGIPSPMVCRLRSFAYRRRKLNIPTWSGRDQHAIHDQVGALDRAIVTTAFTSTSNPQFVTWMPTIFPDLSPRDVTKCFVDIYYFEQEHWGQVAMDVELCNDPKALPFLVVYALRHMLARTDKNTVAWMNDVGPICARFCLPRESEYEQYAELACKTFCQLAVEVPSYQFFFNQAHLVLSRIYGEQKARHSYDTLCHAMHFLESRLDHCDPSSSFPGFLRHTGAVQGILQCLRDTVSGRAQLSPTQANAILIRGRADVARACQWLCNLEWRGLHRGCLAASGDGANVVAFPHIASHYLVRDIIDPLVELCSTPSGLGLVPEELGRTVEHTWSSLQLAYPDAVNIDDVDFVWCSGLDHIDASLGKLRGLLVTQSK